MAEEIELFKKKLSKEEKTYLEAVKLQEAVSCVLRFEQKISALKGAAKMFQNLGDFKDSQERMQACREQLVVERKKGMEEVFAAALAKKENAVSKSDYADAIMEFKRVVKREEYHDRAKEQIQFCKREIAKIETKAAWKRRLTLLCVIVVCAAAALLILDKMQIADISKLTGFIR